MTVENTLPNGLKTSVLGSQYKTEDDENLNLLDGHLGNVGNPHGVTALQAGAEPTLGFTPEDSANKSAANGYASLSVTGKVPVAQLPTATQVGEGVLEIATFAEALAGSADDKIITPKKAFDIINASPNRNAVLNGDFDIWQRGASFSNPATNAFTADRWMTKYNGSGSAFTVSRQAFTLGQTDVPNEPESYLRYDVTTAGSSGTFRQVNNIIESVRLFAGKKVTLSFYAKAASAITLANVRFQEYFGSGGSPSSSVYTTFATSVLITTAWQKFSYTIDVPSISGKTLGSNSNDYSAVVIGMPVNSTFTLDIAQFQLEAGEVATTFEAKSVNHELMHCQRYYVNFTGRTINGDLWVSWPTQMRSAPTLTSTVGTAANGKVNGCTLNNSAAANVTITATAEM